MAENRNGRPPRDNLIRALHPGVELRDGSNGMPTLHGHFAVFNEWTEIDSMWEGHFLERIVPGAFKKTFRENRDSIRALFQHGQDPQVGDKPLGPIETLSEDKTGAVYEVPLLDTAYNRELLPGLKAGLYGASFRFRVTREEMDKEPDPSAYNPTALPERTIREAEVSEFGPVTFPAYANATAGVRSLTDEFIFGRFSRDPQRLAQLLKRADMPAIQYLTDAYECIAGFMEAEDDPDDGPDLAKARQIQGLIQELIQVEAAEDEGAENEGAETASAEQAGGRRSEAAPPEDGAGNSHPIRGRRADSVPLYGGNEEEALDGLLPLAVEKEEVPGWIP